jgi:hypothetical protein
MPTTFALRRSLLRTQARERKQAHFEEDTFNISIEETFAQDSLI